MPTYVVLMNWTEQGAKTASQTADRYDAAKEDLAQHGVTIKDIYWTIGPYDIVRSSRQRTTRRQPQECSGSRLRGICGRAPCGRSAPTRCDG